MHKSNITIGYVAMMLDKTTITDDNNWIKVSEFSENEHGMIGHLKVFKYKKDARKYYGKDVKLHKIEIPKNEEGENKKTDKVS